MEIVGSVDDSVFFEMTSKIMDKDADGLMKSVDDMMMKGRDPGQYVNDYIGHLRNLMITASVSDSTKILNVSSESAEMLKKQAEQISKEELSLLINTFSELAADMKYAANKRILLEVCLIKLCAPVTEADFTSVAAKLSALEREIKSGKYIKNTVVRAEADEKPKQRKKVKRAVSEDYKKAIAIWDDIVGSFSTPDDIIVKKAELKQLDGDKIYIVADNEINSRVLAGKTEEIKAAFENKLEAEFELEVIIKRRIYEKI